MIVKSLFHGGAQYPPLSAPLIGMCMYFGYLGMHTCMVENDGGVSERNKRVSDSLSFVHLPVHVCLQLYILAMKKIMNAMPECTCIYLSHVCLLAVIYSIQIKYPTLMLISGMIYTFNIQKNLRIYGNIVLCFILIYPSYSNISIYINKSILIQHAHYSKNNSDGAFFVHIYMYLARLQLKCINVSQCGVFKYVCMVAGFARVWFTYIDFPSTGSRSPMKRICNMKR